MFGTLQTWWNDMVLWIFIVAVGWAWIIKRYAGDKVKGAAKEAISNQAVSWINRLGKR